MTKDQKTGAGKMQAPDRAAHDETIQAINKAIEEQNKQVQEIQKEIASKSSGKEEFLRKKTEMLAKLDAFNAIIDEHDKQKKEAWEAIKAQRQKGSAERQELSEIRKKLPFDSVEDIDKKIEQIEMKMQTTTMSLKDEKKCLEEIKNLKQQKPEIIKFLSKKSAVVADPTSVDGLLAKVDGLNTQITEARNAKKSQQEQFHKLVEQRKKMTANMGDLFAKRDELQKAIAKQIAARAALREEFNKKNREYSLYMEDMRAAKSAKQRFDAMQREADWETRKAEREAEREEEMPKLAESTLLEQTLSYCRNLIKVEVKKEEAKPVAEVVHNNPEGSFVLPSKKERANTFFAAPTVSKKFRLRNKENKTNNSIKHTVDSLQVFGELKMTPPVTTADVPAIIEKLEEQLAEIKVEQKAWETQKEERRAIIAKTLADAQKRADDIREEARKTLMQLKMNETAAPAEDSTEEAAPAIGA